MFQQRALILLASLALTACISDPDKVQTRPSASSSPSASASSDDSLPSDVESSASPSPSPSGSASPTGPLYDVGTTRSRYSLKQGSSSVTINLQLTDQNPEQPLKANCPPLAYPFSYQVKVGEQTFQQQVDPRLLNPNSPFQIQLDGLKSNQSITINIPAIQNPNNGLRLFSNITQQLTSGSSAKTLDVKVPARVRPDTDNFEYQAGDDLSIENDYDPQDDSTVQGGLEIDKAWEFKNISPGITWENRNYVNIDPETTYLDGLRAVNREVEIPTTASGENVTVEVKLRSPLRPGLYRSNWMMRNRESGKIVMPNAQIYSQLKIAGSPEFQAVQAGDAYDAVDSQLVTADNKRLALPFNYPVNPGSEFQVVYTLKNTGTRTWTNRKLVVDNSNVENRHLLTVSERSISIPTTAPGKTATLGPITYQVKTLDSHYIAWRIQDSSGRKLFEGDPEVVTQVSPMALAAACP